MINFAMRGTVDLIRMEKKKSGQGVKGIGRVSPMKSKVTGKSDSPRRRWIPLSERVSNKPGDIVVNAQPVKPTVDEKDNPKVKLTVVKEKPVVVKEKPTVAKEKPVGVTSKVSKGKDDVVKAPVVAEEVSVVADKALVVKATVVNKVSVVMATVADNVVADKEPVKEKSAGNVCKATVADNVVADKESVKEKSDGNVGKTPVKDKVKVSVLERSLAPVKDNVKASVKDNVEAVGKASVKDKFKAPVKDKVEDNVKAPVKDNVEAPVKDKPKQKDNVKASVKDKPRQKVIPTIQELYEVSVLRSSNQKVKPEVKSKVIVRVSRSKETHVKRKMILSKEDDRKKKLKGKSKKEDSDSELETDDVDSSSDEVERKRKKLKSKLEKKVKKHESNKEGVPKKGKKKMTKKVKKEISDEESVPKKGIGFSSLNNVSIDQLPSKLRRFVVSNFNPETYMLSLDSGDKIEVTHWKIHEILGVPVSGYSLFDLDKREADHEFVRMGKCVELKGHIYLDVVRRHREDSVISDIDWCGYIYDCLQGSKLLEGTNHYLGPLTFLILLYLDSTKFDRFPVVRTRPAIRNWSSHLMKKRQDLEHKDHVLGGFRSSW
uniref:Uncharacterized protein n=1 Tax=Tanacetum cinerariifolium TaxID=118510 RepID=A0A6L2L2G4_TANCI|nr:hypothetical protein [Tanacetum cinerariifolium]